MTPQEFIDKWSRADRIVANGGELPWWHHLVSGSRETVHTAGVSVRGRVSASEKDVPDEKLEEFIVAWPGKWPRGARKRAAKGNEGAGKKGRQT